MSLTTQLATMLAMIGMGSWIGAALDTYSRFLQRPKRAHWVVFINDILFWGVHGLIIFYVLLLVNEGELRFYIFLAILCGYAAYQSLFRRIYLKMLEWTIRFVTALYRFFVRTCYYVIVRPIQWLFQALLAMALLLWKLFLLILNLLYRCIKLLLAPIRWIGYLIWKAVPNKWRWRIEDFFDNLAGVMKKAKNIIMAWISKFRK
ncbi:spore cortex biosynthesis protein YabQ [Thermaerobacillus caldiproteolyticus]|uniref:Spore cortex biosynthesis protein YabQ n=1 Tax=Thermaerobacillus caldiproteolyticus TaxID=247480 RepID=A0A7W0C0F2_9BACL|nr:spore cortex biosynthesis protein YabQ [Anoxybacillus caldiproteolyticus]MBA2876715.1 spore cortex biosynthesis protein YabQ [Anoxybacillus caldiproteolyticus]